MNDYNFFSAYQRKKGLNFDLNSPYFLGAVILIVCAALTLGLLARNLILTVQINSRTHRAEIIKAEDDYILANNLQNSLNAMVNYDTNASIALKKFKNVQILKSDLISSLLNGVPSNVTVTSFEISDTGFGMTCSVPSRKAAAELLQGLKATGLCQEIQLNSVTTNPDGSSGTVSIDGVLKAGTQ